jgi:pimeloyl-ACP methyl ester carboxylesterase
MQRCYFLILLFIFSFISFSSAQEKTRTDKGTLNGANYTILFPDEYQNKLVVFAHGYSAPGSPLFLEGERFKEMAKPFLERGFAFAASEYAHQGFALAQGVDDSENLREYFWEQYQKPDSTFMTGMSMGGGIALAMMENFSESYTGALAMCPLSGNAYLQTRKEFDLRVLFEYLFPGIVTPITEILDEKSAFEPISMANMGHAMTKINSALDHDPQTAQALARKFQIAKGDIGFTLLFGEAVLRDITLKCHGNPFDNTNTIYTGFEQDWEINKNIMRIAATANAQEVFGKYIRNGNIGKPVVLMHTIYDQLIPADPYGETSFEEMVRLKGKSDLLSVKICNGQGHCRFTPDEIGKAFDALRNWVQTGTKASSGVMEN